MTTEQERVILEINGIEHSISRDIKPTLWGKDAGYFVFIKAFFSFVEYLGKLTFGSIKNKTLKTNEGTSVTVKFFEKYFDNKRYYNLAYLLIYMYRHGTVHQHAPELIKLDNGTLISFLVFHERHCIITEENKKHLTRDEIEALSNCKHLEYIKDKWFAFSMIQAFDDILAASKKLKQHICNDNTLAIQMHDRLRIIKNGKDIKNIEWHKDDLNSNIEFIKKYPIA